MNQHPYFFAISAAFPAALWRCVNNFDDIHAGWEIVPEPGEYIKFMYFIDEPSRIIIDFYKLHVFVEGVKVVKKVLFSGFAHEIFPGEIDILFLEKLLRNYKNIG